jgi:hypothetical protein
MTTRLIFIVLIISLLNACATKIPITKIEKKASIKIDRKTHIIDFERISHSIPKDTLYESVQGGQFCELKQGWAIGGMDAYSRGPGVPLYATQAENDAMGIQRPDLNRLAFKSVEDALKKSNIQIKPSADLKLTALITDVKINTCLKPWTWEQKGEQYYKIKWVLYSKALKKDLYENEFESSTEKDEFDAKNVEKMIQESYENNVNYLINDDEFRKTIDFENYYIPIDNSI